MPELNGESVTGIRLEDRPEYVLELSLPALSRTLMLGKHLLERFSEVLIRRLHGAANSASIELATPMPCYPLAVLSPVDCSEDRAILGDVDRPERLK